MDLNLAGKSVIVTGGGSNIGRAISLAFAREGVNLAIADIDEAQAQKAAAAAPPDASSPHDQADRSLVKTKRTFHLSVTGALVRL